MKNLIGILLLIIIGGFTYYLLQKDEKHVRNTEVYDDFAIKDTASVSKIFLSQRNGKKLLLTKNAEGVWMVNNSFEARKDAVELILRTLHDIQIKGNVAGENMESVIKRMATSSTKVEFYTSDSQPEKTWYIGQATESRTGTYMLLEKDRKISAKPFVTHLLMERGYLSSRFFLDPILWKERIVMKIKPEEIKSIAVKHRYDTATSFKVERIEDKKFRMTNLNTGSSNEIPPGLVVPYFKEFSEVYYEYIDVKTDSSSLEDVYSSIPRHTITIEGNDNNKITLRTYDLPVLEGSVVNGKTLDYHPERMYLYSSYMGDEVHPIVQNYTFDKLVPRLEDFESSTTVEK